MFIGTITYNVFEEFYGKFYHKNFRKLVCSVGSKHYIEEFWTDKINKYFIRVFNFETNEVTQINSRYKTYQTTKLNSTNKIEILNPINNENQTSFEIKYDVDFGFKAINKYNYISNETIRINPIISEHIRICSKIPNGNNHIANRFKEIPNSRYRQTKEYRLIATQQKELPQLTEYLSKFQNYEQLNGNLNRSIHNRIWTNPNWQRRFKNRMVAFYETELNIKLEKDMKDNIGAYNSIHFGLMDEEEYKSHQQKLREFEKTYDQ